MVRKRQMFMPSKSKVSQVLLGGAVFPQTHSVTNSLYVLTSLGLGLKTGAFTNNFVKSIYHLYYFLFQVEQNNDQELFRDPFRSLRQNIANWKTYERHKQTKTVQFLLKFGRFEMKVQADSVPSENLPPHRQPLFAVTSHVGRIRGASCSSLKEILISSMRALLTRLSLPKPCC